MSGRTFRWNIVREGKRLHIHLSGVLNAEVDLTALKQLAESSILPAGLPAASAR